MLSEGKSRACRMCVYLYCAVRDTEGHLNLDPHHANIRDFTT